MYSYMRFVQYADPFDDNREVFLLPQFISLTRFRQTQAEGREPVLSKHRANGDPSIHGARDLLTMETRALARRAPTHHHLQTRCAFHQGTRRQLAPRCDDCGRSTLHDPTDYPIFVLSYWCWLRQYTSRRVTTPPHSPNHGSNRPRGICP